MSTEESSKIAYLSHSPTSSEKDFRPSIKIYISRACGRTWRLIQRHPSWFPGVSTATGLVTTPVYSLIAIISLVAMAAGIIIGGASALLPSEELSKNLKRKTITWVSVSHNFFATSFRLAIRGAVSTIPFLGNGLIILADLYNNKSEEHLFSLEENSLPIAEKNK